MSCLVLMPIAVNAVIHPSRLLRLAVAAFALGLAAAGVTVLSMAHAFTAAGALGAACLGTAVLAARAVCTLPNARVLDISGLGEMRLSVQRKHAAAGGEDDTLRLLPGSTLWARLLVLRLRRQHGQEGGAGRVEVLIILPDSVTPGQFRRIAIAAGVIAGRDNKFFVDNKIF
jgi:toxin CptA